MTSFENALIHLKMKCGAIRLPYWAPGVFVYPQYPDENSKMTLPYLYIETETGRVPWNPDAKGLFSDEWELLI